MDLTLITLIAALLLLPLLWWRLERQRRNNAALREENARLQALLESERRHVEIQLQQARGENREQIQQLVQELSHSALKHNSEAFLKLAQASLGRQQEESASTLRHRQHSIENLLEPIRTLLQQTGKQLQESEKERKEQYGALHQHLQNITRDQQQLQRETRNLVQALRRPEVRGQWGELTLRRLTELAGMVEHADFVEQESLDTAEGRLRPDMVIHLPDQRALIVDAKTPLDAYLTAIDADSDELRKQALEQHARNVRKRVRELAAKSYWSQFKESPDFVILFIPGEQFLSSALERDPELLENALSERVVLATPTSLVALLRAIAYGWNQQEANRNSETIRTLGVQLYERLATLGEHLSRIGKGLNSSVEAYNRTVGSLERNLYPSARRFTELGLQPKKELEEPAPIDRIPRAPRDDILPPQPQETDQDGE